MRRRLAGDGAVGRRDVWEAGEQNPDAERVVQREWLVGAVQGGELGEGAG